MDVKVALEFTDKIVYTKTGKHLNDLEREVFIGSWQGQTYEEIYPINPQYLEKDVGYKLWKKLSHVLAEKVTKKNFRGAIERAEQQTSKEGEEYKEDFVANPEREKVPQRVFISYRFQEPDKSLAIHLHEALNTVGHKVFSPTIEGGAILGEDALAHWDSELQECDFFVLLLSPQAAVSEMVIEELRRVKELRDSRQIPKPLVLPIRVNCPVSTPLNHDLRGYLDGIKQLEWKSPADTPSVLQAVLGLLATDSVTNVENRLDDKLLVSASHSLLLASDLPLPVAEPELPTGQVRLASAFYVERVPYEAQCYKEILQPGALIRIKAPRQMGKTSLMARILYRANEQGYRTVPLSFQHADTAVFTDLTQLLRWFCARISRKLRLPYQLDDYWTDTYGSKDNCTIYFEDCLLSETDSPLVLGLDEVDRVFQYPKIADDFFGLLRAWYEEAGYGNGDSDRWQLFRLVVVHSTEVYIPLNVNQSPFNVGLPIELPDFSAEQVQDLTQRHGLNWNAAQVQQLMKLVGGHPYLVRLALYHIAQQTITLKQLLETAPTEAGLYDDHLRRHLWNLQQHPELAMAFAKVVTTDAPVELESVPAFKLHSMGLVQMQGNQVMPRFDLYRQYFRDRLIGDV